MKITVRNPYFDKEYKVIESKQVIEQCLKNIHNGNEDFLHLHTKEGIMPLTISPKCYASIEFEADKEDE